MFPIAQKIPNAGNLDFAFDEKTMFMRMVVSPEQFLFQKVWIPTLKSFPEKNYRALFLFKRAEGVSTIENISEHTVLLGRGVKYTGIEDSVTYPGGSEGLIDLY